MNRDKLATRLHEEALLQLLMVSPNMLTGAAILVVLIAPWSYYDVNAAFMIGWSATTFAIGAVREYLHHAYRQTAAGMRHHKRKVWLRVARHGSTAYGLSFAVMTWVTFPHIDLQDRIAISFLASAWMPAGVRFTAPAAAPMLAIVLLSVAMAWLLWGGEYAVAGFSVALGLYLVYEPARRRQLHRVLEQIALIHRSRQLSEELGERNAQLKALNREQTSMLIVASHDLRQPVHALGMLAEEAPASSDVLSHAKRLRLARLQVVALNEMLRDLTEYAQLEIGVQSVRRSYVPIQQLVQTVAAGLDAMPGPARQPIRIVDLVGQHVDVHVNPELLTRLLRNQLHGALLGLQTGWVDVVMERGSGDRLHLHIRHSGAPPASLDAELDAKLAKRSPELLGFALVPGDDQGESRQMTLTWEADRLKWARAGPAAVASAAEPIPVQTKLGRRVMLLEDDQELYQVMAEMLGSWGYRVDGGATLGDGLSALESRGFAPDLILSDYRLAQGENGLDCIRQIRELLRSPGLPAILLTGDIQLELGVPTTSETPILLRKPLRPSHLRKAIADRLG